jgi:acetyltransferase-like isoleucine patch superfamily enzyme
MIFKPVLRKIRAVVRPYLSPLNFFRLLRARFSGARVGSGVFLGRNLSLSGRIVIEDGVRIEDDVVLSGDIQVGTNTCIQKLTEITGNISIGANSLVGAFSFLSTGPKGRLKIGADVLVNAYSVLGASSSVDIGDHCIFAPYVQITDATHGIEDTAKLAKHTDFSSSPVVLGKNVWLGSAAMVMKGVTVGEGAVIGAKALVTRSIPPFAVAYGIPAKVARIRDDETEKD